MSKKLIGLGLVLTTISTFFLVLARSCYISVGEEPWACLPLVTPSLPFTFLANLLGIPYDGPTNWTLIIVGSAIVWFLFGVLIKLLIYFFYRLKTK